MADGILTICAQEISHASCHIATITNAVTQAQTDAAALSDYLLATYPSDTQWQALLQTVQADIDSLVDTGILPPPPPILRATGK